MAKGNERTTHQWPSRKRPSPSRATQPRGQGRGRRGPRPPKLPEVSLWTPSFRTLVLICIAAIIASAAWWLYRSPMLTVQHVEIEGTQIVQAENVAAAAGLSGASILRIDLEAARSRVEAIPEVKTATVTRHFPNTVKIAVQERTPAAFWMIGGRRYVVDNEGVVLGGGLPDDSAPIITQQQTDWNPAPGERVDAGALTLARRLLDTSERSLGLRVVKFEFRDSNGLTAVFDNGLQAVFGDPHDFDYKVAALFMLMRQTQADDVELHSVDLRFGDRLAYR